MKIKSIRLRSKEGWLIKFKNIGKTSRPSMRNHIYSGTLYLKGVKYGHESFAVKNISQLKKELKKPSNIKYWTKYM